MVNTLDDILKNLQDDKNRLEFLEKLYVPGNIEVADKILTLNPEHSSVLENEIKRAQENKLDERFTALAEKYINYYVKHGWDITLRGIVIKWNNPSLAEYAISKMTAKSNEDGLKYAADIAKAFSKNEEAKTFLERLLKLQRPKEKDYPFSPAGTCVELGRYDEAIDIYLRCNEKYYNIDSALRVAQDHAPHRLREIAEKGFACYRIGSNDCEDTFAECAKIVGKTDDARKLLSKCAKKLKADRYSPRFYESLVKALMTLDCKQEAIDVVEKVAKHELELSKTKDYSKYTRVDNARELASLYHLIGKEGNVKGLYLVIIEQALEDRWHPSNILNEIAQGYEFTKDNAFLEKKIEVFERLQKYDEAEKLAMQFGKTELAETYHKMQEMITATKQVGTNQSS